MKKSKVEKENRQSSRVRVVSLVRYTIPPGISSHMANIQNISRGGLAFLADHEVKPGTILKLRFVVPHKKGSIEVEGASVRCPQDTRDPALFQVAVRFTDLSEEAKGVIHELETIISKQRKAAKK